MTAYNPCPVGYELVGLVCRPIPNFAISRFKSQKKQKEPEPEPEPAPEPEPEPAPAPEPEPEPAPEPEPEPAPEPDPTPSDKKTKNVVLLQMDTIGLNQKEAEALLISAGVAVTGGTVRAVTLGTIKLYKSAMGAIYATNNAGQGAGDIEGIELQTLSMQDETTALLRVDENNVPVANQEFDDEEWDDIDLGDFELPNRGSSSAGQGGDEGDSMIDRGSGCGRRLMVGGVSTCTEEDADADADVIADEELQEMAIQDAMEETGLTEEEILLGLEEGILDFSLEGAVASAGASLVIGGLTTAVIEILTNPDRIAQEAKDIEKETEITGDPVQATEDEFNLWNNPIVNPIESAGEAVGKGVNKAVKETGEEFKKIGKGIKNWF